MQAATPSSSKAVISTVVWDTVEADMRSGRELDGDGGDEEAESLGCADNRMSLWG